MIRRIVCAALLAAVAGWLGGCGSGPENKINMPTAGDTKPPKAPGGVDEPD
jgi:hypothetical protein